MYSILLWISEQGCVMNLSKGVGKVTCKAGMKCEMVVYVLLGSLLTRIIGERRLFLKKLWYPSGLANK